MGVASFQQAGDFQGPVHLPAPGPGRRLPPTRQRFAEQDDRGRAGPFVLVVDTSGTLLRGRHRRTGFPDQLHRLLVHAHDGTIRIVGFLIQVQCSASTTSAAERQIFWPVDEGLKVDIEVDDAVAAFGRRMRRPKAVWATLA